MYYREWTPTPERRRGRMYTTGALERLVNSLDDPGYASVYMFDERAANEISTNGHSRDLSQYSVIASALILDIDDGEAGLKDATDKLNAHGLTYDVWSSGGKGFHIYIPHKELHSTHLPYTHRLAVERLGIQTDMSLYQHGRIISLPGRLHPKTGQRKRFLYHVEGVELELEIVERPAFNFKERGGLDTLTTGLMRFTKLSTNEPAPGMRHTALWGAAKELADAGLSLDAVLEIAQKVNESWENPKEPDEVERAVRQAF